MIFIVIGTCSEEKFNTANNKESGDKKLCDLKEQIMAMKDGEKPFTLIMDDPASNSYLQVTISNDLPVHSTNKIRFILHDNTTSVYYLFRTQIIQIPIQT